MVCTGAALMYNSDVLNTKRWFQLFKNFKVIVCFELWLDCV